MEATGECPAPRLHWLLLTRCPEKPGSTKAFQPPPSREQPSPGPDRDPEDSSRLSGPWSLSLHCHANRISLLRLQEELQRRQGSERLRQPNELPKGPISVKGTKPSDWAEPGSSSAVQPGTGRDAPPVKAAFAVGKQAKLSLQI